VAALTDVHVTRVGNAKLGTAYGVKTLRISGSLYIKNVP